MRRAGRSGQHEDPGQQDSNMRRRAAEQERCQNVSTGEVWRDQVGERETRADASLPLGGDKNAPPASRSREDGI